MRVTERDALAGHEPAGDRLGAADRHRDHPPRRGPAAAAAGADGRGHHLDRRRDQARLHLRRRRSTPAWPRGPASTSTSASPASASARACCTPRLHDAGLGAKRARVPRAALAGLHRAGRDRRGHALRRRRRAPDRRAPRPGPHADQRADGRCSSGARRCSALLRAALRQPRRARAHRRRERGAGAASLALVAAGYGLPQPQARHRVGHRPGAHGLRRAPSAPCARPPRELSRFVEDVYEHERHRCPATPTRSSASPATPTRPRSRRPSASSRASCTRTSTRTTPTPRRSSRRPPRPTRSSTTPSAARPIDRYGHEGLRSRRPGAELRRLRLDLRPLRRVLRRRRSAAASAARAARARAATSRSRVEIDLDQAARGAEVEVAYEAVDRCEHCHGNGAEPGTPIESCERCGGHGVLQAVTRVALRPGRAPGRLRRLRRRRQVATQPCETCDGRGLVVGHRRLEVDVPAGHRRRSADPAGRAWPCRRPRRPAGRPLRCCSGRVDDGWMRDGDDLVTVADVPAPLAALGTTVTIEHPDGDVAVEVPAGTQPGAVLTLEDKGMPMLRRQGRFGDLRVVANVVIPRRLNAQQRELLERAVADLDQRRRAACARDESMASPEARARLPASPRPWGADVIRLARARQARGCRRRPRRAAGARAGRGGGDRPGRRPHRVRRLRRAGRAARPSGRRGPPRAVRSSRSSRPRSPTTGPTAGVSSTARSRSPAASMSARRGSRRATTSWTWSSIPARRSGPARTTRRGSAWSCWPASPSRRRRPPASWTSAAAPASWRSLRPSSAGARSRASTTSSESVRATAENAAANGVDRRRRALRPHSRRTRADGAARRSPTSCARLLLCVARAGFIGAPPRTAHRLRPADPRGRRGRRGLRPPRPARARPPHQRRVGRAAPPHHLTHLRSGSLSPQLSGLSRPRCRDGRSRSRRAVCPRRTCHAGRRSSARPDIRQVRAPWSRSRSASRPKASSDRAYATRSRR